MNHYLIDFVSKYIDLTEEEKTGLLELKDIISFHPKNSILLKEGQTTQKGFFVLKGCIRTYFNVEGEEKTTAFYTELEGFRPVCALENKPSEYYADCLEDCLIASSTPDTELEFNAKFPRLDIVCARVAEEHIHRQIIEINSLKILNPENRYLKLQEDRPDLIQRVPQQHIASFLGITPQSLSRIRARLRYKNANVQMFAQAHLHMN